MTTQGVPAAHRECELCGTDAECFLAPMPGGGVMWLCIRRPGNPGCFGSVKRLRQEAPEGNKE